MKKLLTLATSLTLFFTTSAQSLYWAKKLNSEIHIHYSKTTSVGDVILVGSFKGTADFDPGSGVVNLTSIASSDDIFIAKYLNTGTLSWAKKIGGSKVEFINDLKVDNNDNIIICGKVYGVVDFNPSSAENKIGSSSNYTSYIAKYTNSGNFTWVKAFDGYDVQISHLSTDVAGKIIISGSFGYASGQADFNPAPSVTNKLTSGGGSSSSGSFVAAYSPNGAYDWAKSYGNNNVISNNGLFVDESKNIYLTGTFTGTADFNPSPSATSNLTSSGNYDDVFFMKLKADGSFVFAKAILGNGTLLKSTGGIVVDQSGNIIIAGTFDKTVDFDPSSGVKNLTTSSVTNTSDIFIAQYSSTGTYKWAKKIGNLFLETLQGIELTKNYNILVYGNFLGSVDFNPGTATHTLISTGSTTGPPAHELFVLSLKNDGNFNFAYKLGNTNQESATTISCHKLSNEFYITGTFLGTVNFNPSGTATNLTASATTNVFLAKYALSLNGIMQNEDSENRIFDETNSQISNLTTQISIYPNPANNLLNIEYNGFENTNANNIKIYDITGKEVSNYSVTNNNNTTSQLNISNFESGVYIISIQTQNKIIREKFIKQ